MIEMTVLYGSVELGRPTGRWLIREGWGWYREYTSTRWLDQHGHVFAERAYEPFMFINGDPSALRSAGIPAPDEPRRPWWKIWGR